MIDVGEPSPIVGGTISGLVVPGVIRKQAEQVIGTSLKTAPLHGFRIGSYLHVLALISIIDRLQTLS